MASAWFNGPDRDGNVALVGGPYATKEEAIAAKPDDDRFAENCGIVRYDPWWTWYSVEVKKPEKVTTLRQRLASGVSEPPSLVRL